MILYTYIHNTTPVFPNVSRPLAFSNQFFLNIKGILNSHSLLAHHLPTIYHSLSCLILRHLPRKWHTNITHSSKEVSLFIFNFKTALKVLICFRALFWSKTALCSMFRATKVMYAAIIKQLTYQNILSLNVPCVCI